MLVFVGFVILFVFSAFLVYRLGHHDGLSRQPAPPPAPIVQIISNVDSIKNLGQLLVMKAALKVIVTAERPCHSAASTKPALLTDSYRGLPVRPRSFGFQFPLSQDKRGVGSPTILVLVRQ